MWIAGLLIHPAMNLKAIQDYDQALQIDSQYAVAYYFRGNAYYDLGEYRSAILSYGQAIQVNSEYIEAYKSRASAYEKLNDFKSEISDLEKNNLSDA
ncbi:MAG: tetratricopeptide repeat protein [Anaerolineales bacterium]|nr:tetratricopeptide repeat protein [Anaerolineales bacterium]